MDEKRAMVKMGAQALAMPNIELLEGVAQHFIQSGYFKDVRDLSQAVVKVMAGQEVGLGSFASMVGVHIIEGKPSFSATVLAALAKRDGYTWRVKWDNSKDGGLMVRIVFFDSAREELGESSFSMVEAQRAGLASKGNWQKFPRAMLFARAMSQGIRWFAPEVTAGMSAYTIEELQPDVLVNEDGEPRLDRKPLTTPAYKMAAVAELVQQPRDVATSMMNGKATSRAPQANVVTQPEPKPAPVQEAALQGSGEPLAEPTGYPSDEPPDFDFLGIDGGQQQQAQPEPTKAEPQPAATTPYDTWDNRAMVDSIKARRAMAHVEKFTREQFGKPFARVSESNELRAILVMLDGMKF